MSTTPTASSWRRPTAESSRTARDRPELTVNGSWDLKPYVPFGDCLVGLVPDWSGRIWWASAQGLVGTIAPATGQVGVVDLDEEIRRGLAVDDAGGVYVVTDAALHRLAPGPDGAPQPTWRTAYNGTSGAAPVVLDGGVVAITDSVDSRMGVLFVRRDSGQVICRQPVFDADDGATDSPLAPLGSGVAVTNNHGYASPRSALFGFTTSPGIARVDLIDGACVERWSSDVVSPGSGVTASRADGLIYAWTKRPSLLGVSAWYLTALDATTGRTVFSVRTGTGVLAGSDGSQITLGPDGTAWLGTMAGLVRVRDRD